MKYQLFIPFFLLFMTMLRAQQTSESTWQKVKLQPAKYLNLNWGRNTPTLVQATERGLLPIEIQIQSSDSVGSSMIKVFVDGVARGNKGDDVRLMGNPKELIYAQSLILNDGVSKVEVEVTNKVGTKRTEPRFFQKKGNSITLLTNETMNQQKVIWQLPTDPMELYGKPYAAQQPEVEIKLSFTTPQYIEKKDIIIYHNKRAIAPSGRASLNNQDGRYIFKDYVMLDEKEEINRLFLIVKTPNMEMQSEPLLIDYRSLRPNLHVLSIGTKSDLSYTTKDANDFAKLYKNQGGESGNKLFNSVSVGVLTDSYANASEIKGRVEELKTNFEMGKIKSNDVIIIFISSHGFVYNKELRFRASDYTAERNNVTSVSLKKEILDVLEDVHTKKIIFIDACHSGGKGSIAEDINQEIAKLNSVQKGVAIVASSLKAEESYEDKVWQNGAFTYALLRGMQDGAADSDNNTIITLDELDKYLQVEVPRIVAEVKEKPQHPIMMNTELGNIAIFVRQK